MEKKEYKTKYETQEITLANGFNSLQSTKKQLDDDYDFCDGVAVVEKSNANNDQYDVSIADNTQTYIEPIPKQLYESGNGVDPNDRYKNVFIDIDSGKKTDVRITADVATTAEIKLTVVFRLRKLITSTQEVA